jgi:hypothetical protein
VTINFQPSNDRATILQAVTDPMSGSKSTTTLTVTWGGDKKGKGKGMDDQHSQPSDRHIGRPDNRPIMNHNTGPLSMHSDDASAAEGELPSLSKFRAEHETQPMQPVRSKFKADDPSPPAIGTGTGGGDGMWTAGDIGLDETQPWRKMSGKDTRPIRMQVQGEEGESRVDPKNQILVYDMRK